MKPVYLPFFFLIIILSITNCTKDNSDKISVSGLQWMKVFNDSTIFTFNSTELTQSGCKIVSDNDGNLFLTYYNPKKNEGVLLSFTFDGKLLWRKYFENYRPLDIINLPDGRIILAMEQGQIPKNIMLFSLKDNTLTDSVLIKPLNGPAGSGDIVLSALPDNGIILIAADESKIPPNSAYTQTLFFAKISPDFKIEWRKNHQNFIGQFTSYYGGYSITPVDENKYIFHASYLAEKTDTTESGFISGLINYDGTLDTYYVYKTGIRNPSGIINSGVFYDYDNQFLNDGNGNFIYYFAYPLYYGNPKPKITSGFFRIGSDAKIKDTVELNLPSGESIVYCIYKKNKFLMTTFNVSHIQSTFLTGGDDLKVKKRFQIQDNYFDFFPSSVFTSDDGFVAAGVLQSFNGKQDRLVLVKWK